MQAVVAAEQSFTQGLSHSSLSGLPAGKPCPPPAEAKERSGAAAQIHTGSVTPGPHRVQAVDQSELEAAIKEAESVSAQSKTARQQADELSRKSNDAWEKVRSPTAFQVLPAH